jgi:hypothetical protein
MRDPNDRRPLNELPSARGIVEGSHAGETFSSMEWAVDRLRLGGGRVAPAEARP